jgi:hypothetical protein
MTTHNLTSGTNRRERVSFVPTTFFVEFLAGAQGLASEPHQNGRGYAKHRQTQTDIAPALPSRGR